MDIERGESGGTGGGDVKEAHGLRGLDGQEKRTKDRHKTAGQGISAEENRRRAKSLEKGAGDEDEGWVEL